MIMIMVWAQHANRISAKLMLAGIQITHAHSDLMMALCEETYVSTKCNCSPSISWVRMKDQHAASRSANLIILQFHDHVIHLVCISFYNYSSRWSTHNFKCNLLYSCVKWRCEHSVGSKAALLHWNIVSRPPRLNLLAREQSFLSSLTGCVGRAAAKPQKAAKQQPHHQLRQ